MSEDADAFIDYRRYRLSSRHYRRRRFSAVTFFAAAPRHAAEFMSLRSWLKRLLPAGASLKVRAAAR